MVSLLLRIAEAVSPERRARRLHRDELLRIRVQSLRDRTELERQASRTRAALLSLARRQDFLSQAHPTWTSGGGLDQLK